MIQYKFLTQADNQKKQDANTRYRTAIKNVLETLMEK